ncbi:hypothetical protein GGR57DRAFT_298450 [Xylariaceae sp. FL1272]|nr:hypothetical protein GGR57DRAFT_298450 [Xylariaceae sp. FL1272]
MTVTPFSVSSTASASGISSTTTASTSSSTPACQNLYEIPIVEAACAVPYGGNHTDAMSACCKSADVVSYGNNCGLFCIAEDQTIKELEDCLFDEGVAYQSVFCNANLTATATNTDPSVPASASASVIVTGGSESDDASETGSGDDADPTDSDSAAPGLAPALGVTTTGVTIGALLLSALAFGAFQF